MSKFTEEFKITRRLKIIFWALVIFSSTMLYSIMGSSLQTPFYINKLIKLNISYFLPQGWAFFTRDAREEKVFAFKRQLNGKLTKLSPPSASYIYLFGLNREGRKLSSEYLSLLSQIDRISWISCNYDLDEIAIQSHKIKPISLKSDTHISKCCGEIIFVKTRLKPWAWNKFESIEMPAKFIRLYVSCSNK